MKKNQFKKGISLIVLVIAIIVLIILSGIIVISSLNSVESGNINMFATEITNIQTEVDNYYYRYSSYPVGTSRQYTVPSGTTDFDGENKVNGIVTFKEIDFATLSLKNLQFGSKEDANDVYVVSENTGKVYYLKGVEYRSKVYYTINDDFVNILGVSISKSSNYKDIVEYDVIFSVSNVNPTNSPVTVTVKIPKTATVNSVTATNSKVVSSETSNNNYKIYNVNETGNSRNGNYDITVNYTLNGVTKVAKYSVTNFSSTSPAITYTSEVNNGLRTVTVNVTGNDIKKIKYETSYITDNTYFVNYGKTIKNNIFTIPKNTSFTIYVEDENGNNATKTLSYWKYKKDTNQKYTLVTNGTQDIEIGDTVNYRATGTSYNGVWKVLGANNNGEIMIISNANVESKSLGSTSDIEKARSDWENTETILDNICVSYGNGTGASSTTPARSVRIQDINKLTGYNPINTGVYDPDQEGIGLKYTNGTVEFNGTKTCTSGTYYVEGAWMTASSRNPVTMTQTYYTYYPETLTNSSSDTKVGLNVSVPVENKIRNMIITGDYYWLAYPCVQCTSGVSFYVIRVNIDCINNGYLVNGFSGNQNIAGVRAVVSLTQEVILTGSSSTGWTINI